MTKSLKLKARAVLDDCEAAFAELQTASQYTLRRRWFTTVALLRAVGHVLDKVDGESDPALRRAVTAQFDELKAQRSKYAVFWQFIEQERNSVLKI